MSGIQIPFKDHGTPSIQILGDWQQFISLIIQNIEWADLDHGYFERSSSLFDAQHSDIYFTEGI